MAKYLVIFNSTEKATEQMNNATPEQMQASMSEWMKWKESADKQAKIDWGMPLQAVGKIMPSGETTCDSLAAGYMMAEADSKDIVMELFATHPHLQRANATIDVLEMLSMPGMDAS